jgi:hypothetical protein
MATPKPTGTYEATYQPQTSTTTTTTSTTTAAPDADAKAKAKAKPDAERFRVLKAFTLDDGRTVMPGETFSPADVEKWPERRTKQLEEQKYLRPIK